MSFFAVCHCQKHSYRSICTERKASSSKSELWISLAVFFLFQCVNVVNKTIKHVRNLSLSSEYSRPNTQESPSEQAETNWSTTRMWTSHQRCTWSGTWSPTACTLSGWPVTAARARRTGRPGWSYAPKKEVRRCLFSPWMCVCGVSSSEVSRGQGWLCYLTTDWVQVSSHCCCGLEPVRQMLHCS